MSYVERNLIPGEKVFYKTGLHWSVLIGPFFLGGVFFALALLLAIYADSDKSAASGPSGIALIGVGVLAIIAATSIITGIFRRRSLEMAVTNKRVITKAGIFTRQTFELLLSKIESIGVEESLMGRMFGFGTVTIRGTGGTSDPFRKIAHPLEFRKQVQEHIEIYQRQSSAQAQPAPPVEAPKPAVPPKLPSPVTPPESSTAPTPPAPPAQAKPR
jgi:uncharacterized membrane protein YdbT with pleckstrin-like domain